MIRLSTEKIVCGFRWQSCEKHKRRSRSPAFRWLANGGSRLDDGSVFDHDRVEERHGFAQLGADLLNLVAALLRAEALELLAARVLVRDKTLGELAALDVGEHILHGLLCRFSDDARAGHVVTPLGG